MSSYGLCKQFSFVVIFPEQSSYQFIQSLHNGWEARSVRAVLLPAVEHQLMNGLGAIHRCRKTVILLDGFDHVLVWPGPVRPFAIGHKFPHDNAKTPDVRGRRELPESNCFWGCPSNWNLSSTCGVCSVDICIRDFAGQAKVGDLAHELRIYLKIIIKIKISYCSEWMLD